MAKCLNLSKNFPLLKQSNNQLACLIKYFLNSKQGNFCFRLWDCAVWFQNTYEQLWLGRLCFGPNGSIHSVIDYVVLSFQRILYCIFQDTSSKAQERLEEVVTKIQSNKEQKESGNAQIKELENQIEEMQRRKSAVINSVSISINTQSFFWSMYCCVLSSWFKMFILKTAFMK